ncbi:MAG: protein kinase [Planctomycetaceae bacterium]|nr:protein kinase [Planctomycetaceae bacterium]
MSKQSSNEEGGSPISKSDLSANQRAKYAGRRLGKFQIVGELGRGGMGVVFEAVDTVLERNVAIKLLPRSISAQPEALERFLREARAVAQLSHPNVIAVYEADQFNGQYYIVLELVRGGSLQDALKTGPLGWVEATRVLADVCRGLDVAHRAGLIHRDIKPSNLMRSEGGIAKLADFGLVRANESTGATMTISGSVLGTPQYMSPEQCRSERADERSDLYAMGATYFTMLTGRPPYPGDAPLLVMNAHLLDPIPDPREVDATIPEACSSVIQRAMAKDPDDRYSSAAALMQDLESLLSDSGTEVVDTAGSKWRGLSRSPTTSTTVRPVALIKPGPSYYQWIRSLKYRPAWIIAIIGCVVSIAGSAGWMAIYAPTPKIRMGQDHPKSSHLQLMVNKRPSLPRTPIALPAGAFQLPGMKWESQSGDSRHDVWSMDYPNITRVYLPSSGEFLVVLTNGTSTSRKGPWQSQVTVWNRKGVKLLDQSLPGRASGGAISADSRRLAVGTTGGRGVLLWDTKTWTPLPSAMSQAPYVNALALSDNGQWLAFATSKNSKDCEWILWDLDAQHQAERRVVKESGAISTIEFAPGQELLVVTGGQDGLVRHWRGTQAELLPRTFAAGQPILAAAFRPGGHLQATGAGKSFSLWDYQRNVRIFVTKQLAVQVDDVAFSPDGEKAYFAAGPSVEIVDSDTGSKIDRLTCFSTRVLSMALTPDGAGLFTASTDGKLKFCRVAR